MGKTDPNSANKDPDDIHNGTQATWFIWFVYNIFSERYESQHGKFQCLYPKRDPDYGQAQEYT